MIFTEQQIKGDWLVKSEPASDNRGASCRHFCKDKISKFYLQTSFVQTNVPKNFRKHTLERYNYQLTPIKKICFFDLHIIGGF